MANVQYTIFSGATQTADGDVVGEGVITIAGSAAGFGPVDPNGGNRPRVVRLFAEGKCFVTWTKAGTDAAADGTEGRMMGAEHEMYVKMPADYTISIIQRS